MNWRATHVLTSRRDLAIVPNSTIAKSKILNANFPSVHGITIAVQLESRTPPASGTNILELAVLNSRSILAFPRPTVRVTSIDASQTGYEITFFVEQLNSATAAQNELLDLICRHVAVAGAQLAAPKNGPYPAREEETVKEKTGPQRMLDLVAIFATLMPNERASIAAKLTQISYEKGDTLVEPGTVLQSLFIVGNGVLLVTKRDKRGETELLRFGPGDTFGETGLLTGASSGANITALAPSTVYELAKTDLALILEARPPIAQELSRALAQQQNAGRALATVERDEAEEKGRPCHAASGACGGPAGGSVATGMKKISYRGYRFPPEIIQQAIWLYLRFTLSLRDVEDLLAERGIMVSYETVRRWVNHFGPMIAADLRKRRPKPHTTWHLDQV